MSSPIILCTPSHCAPHHAPHLIRLYIPSGSQTWEDPRDVLLHLGGSVGPPAEWLGSKIGCVSLNQQAISGNAAGGLLQILGLVERDVPCKAHKITGRDDLL